MLVIDHFANADKMVNQVIEPNWIEHIRIRLSSTPVAVTAMVPPLLVASTLIPADLSIVTFGAPSLTLGCLDTIASMYTAESWRQPASSR